MNSQRQTGSYYTPKFIANFIVEWIAKQSITSFSKVLEPSCGDGVFIDSILDICNEREVQYLIDSVEINSDVADYLKNKYVLNDCVQIYNNDFMDFQCFNYNRYSLVIGNPPYIKRSLLSDKQVLLSKKIFESYQDLTNSNLKISGVAFLYVQLGF